MSNQCRWLWAMAWICALQASALAAEIVAKFDLTDAESAKAWRAQHDISEMRPTSGGLLVRISGIDPYIAGPAFDCPDGQPLWLHIRMKSDEGGRAQVFYFRGNATEEASVRFAAPPGEWADVRVGLPALGKGYRLRLDPPGSGGTAIVSLIEIEKRASFAAPAWPAPAVAPPGNGAQRIKSGELTLAHGATFGNFEIALAGRKLAVGHSRLLIGYLGADRPHWIDLSKAQSQLTREGDAIVLSATMKDPDGGTWTVRQTFSPGAEGSIDVATEIGVDRERQALFVPMFAMCPGVGSFGQQKDHGLFAGLEYLDKDEPSSSEADIIGPGSKRQVPDTLRITMPLMAISAEGRWVGLIWKPGRELCAIFDSPDRIFKSGGHVMGLLYPGANGNNREDGSLLPHYPQLLSAGQSIRASATIIAGKGESVVPAIEKYVSLRGLPKVPDTKLTLADYSKLAAAGWLDSQIRQGARFRHAWPGGFQPQPAADAPVWMDWLSSRCGDKALSERLTQASADALGQVNPGSYAFSGVSHVRYPVAALLYGQVAENARRAGQQGWALLRRFEPDGTLLYRPSAGGVDYGKTHFAKDANGLTSQIVMTVLESAVLSGDAKLIAEGLRVLRGMDKFANSAPRGAQTWECPLHTPDVLASAHLVRAYTLGYELTGEAHFLDMARYWAWTGVPFIYLVNPTDREIGPYAGIAVYGATHWKAPNWMGLPVQWCALVYADALYRFERHDPKGPWRQIADGITASGVQQTWPIGSNAQRQGLLPDSFVLRSGIRNDAAINPGTVQANAVRLYKQPEVYSFHCFRKAGLMVHAPGELTELRETGEGASFKVANCIKPSCWVLICGVKREPRVSINGSEPDQKQVQYVKDGGWVVVSLKGDAELEVRP